MGTPSFAVNNKLTHMAKQVLKICRQEIADIENCPDCYLHAHSGNEEWFLEVCVSIAITEICIFVVC